eukprot:6810270-Alexandrium_andersonii.AAC.1
MLHKLACPHGEEVGSVHGQQNTPRRDRLLEPYHTTAGLNNSKWGLHGDERPRAYQAGANLPQKALHCRPALERARL